MVERQGSRSRMFWSYMLLLWKFLGETGKISWQAISMAALIRVWLFEALGIEDEKRDSLMLNLIIYANQVSMKRRTKMI